jgi:diguanylate cyclase (GGDEF)-like protein/PAS domain S-box-containing protein
MVSGSPGTPHVMQIGVLVREWSGLDERYRHLALALLVGVGYWALASFSLALPVSSSGISYIWPADGLALGALLCARARRWPYYLAAVFLGNILASHKPLALNLLYSSFNVFEPWLVATVVTRVVDPRSSLGSVAATARLIFLILVAMAAAILVTNTVDWLIHRGDFWRVWSIWYLSNTLGMLVIAPLVLSFSGDLRGEWGPATSGQRVEAIALLAGLVLFTHLIYSATTGEAERWPMLSSTPMLVPTVFLIWSAVRFAGAGGTLCVAVLALQSFWDTANGLGPYALLHADSHESLVHLQLTLAVMAVLVMVVSSVANDWRRALADSQASKKRLDRALESARLALWEADVASGRVHLSEGWARMIGAPPGETDTTVAELLELTHPEDRDAAIKVAREAISGTAEGYDSEHRIRRRDGEWIWVLDRGRVIERDPSGRALRIAGTNVEVTERKRTEQRLHYLATRDALTDLTNRALFGDGVQKAIEEAGRWSDRVALISVGLDRFTAINDSLGQHVGDLVLKSVADRLTAAVGAEITVARPGGDEFLLLMPRIQSPHEAADCAESVLAAICKPVSVEDRKLVVTASIGIAIYPDDGDSAGLLLRNADIALHNAKDAGRNHVQFFTERMNIAARTRLETEEALRHGLEREEFIVHYQPQVDLATGALVGFESLVRWQHPERGLVLPGDFIEVAESTGLIVELGEGVLRTACQHAALWQVASDTPLTVAVNVSARQFRHKGFVESVKAALASAPLDPRLLELEITENTIMEHGADTTATLEAIGRTGVQLAIDDFGTGYSSLSYLKRLPIDMVKIDQSFVADLPGDPDAGAIVGAIIALAHNLGLKVVAEGVETREQFAYLRDHGCDRAQGYFFGRPQPPELLGAGDDGHFGAPARDASAHFQAAPKRLDS